MRTKIIDRIFQVDGAFATGTDACVQTRQRRVVAQFLPPLRIRQLLGQALALQVAIQGDHRLPPDAARCRIMPLFLPSQIATG